MKTPTQSRPTIHSGIVSGSGRLLGLCLLTAALSVPVLAADERAAGQSPSRAASPVSSEEMRTRLLNTLDNAEAVAAGIGMTEILQDQIDQARADVLSASDADLYLIPESLHGNMGMLEVGTGQLRMAYDPALQPAKSQDKNASSFQLEQADGGVWPQSASPAFNTNPLAAPNYPSDVPWGFSFKAEKPDRDADQPDDGEGEESGACQNPGTTYKGRVIALNAQIVATAVDDISHDFCALTLLGFNVSPICVVTSVIKAIAVGIDSNQALCNEHLGAAEVSATWAGLNVIHGNVQHIHDDIDDAKAVLSDNDTAIMNKILNHDTNMKVELNNHDAGIKSALGQHETNIMAQAAAHDAAVKAQVSTHDIDIKALLAQLQASADANSVMIQTLLARQLETIRLLHTPQGERTSDVPACGGEACAWPNKIKNN